MKWLCLLAFGGLGLIGLVCGLVWGARRYSLYKAGVRATGTVVGIEESVSTERENGQTRTSTSYYPRVEFAANGKTFRFRASTGTGGGSPHQQGDTVAIIYDPKDPTVAQMAEFEQFWLGPVVISVASFVFMLLGIGGFIAIGESDREFAKFDAIRERDFQELNRHVQRRATPPGEPSGPFLDPEK